MPDEMMWELEQDMRLNGMEDINGVLAPDHADDDPEIWKND